MTDLNAPPTTRDEASLTTTATLRTDASAARPSFPAFSEAFGQGAIPPAPSTAFIKREIARCKRINRAVLYASIAVVFAIYATSGYGCFHSYFMTESPFIAGFFSFLYGTIATYLFSDFIAVPLLERFTGAYDSLELLADISPDQAPAILALCRQHPELDAYRQACIGLGRPLIVAEAKAFNAYSDAAATRVSRARADLAADIQNQREASERAAALIALASPTPRSLAPAENANMAARGMISSLRGS